MASWKKQLAYEKQQEGKKAVARKQDRRKKDVSEAEREKEEILLSSHRLINPMMPGDQFKL